LSRNPVVTGTSVLALKYKDGIMMAADCLASYGSLARFRDMQRLFELGETTLLGSSGDIADSQQTVRMLERYRVSEECEDDGHTLSPRQWYTALSSHMYGKRSEMNPLWNTHIVAGVDPKNGERSVNCINWGQASFTHLHSALKKISIGHRVLI